MFLTVVNYYCHFLIRSLFGGYLPSVIDIVKVGKLFLLKVLGAEIFYGNASNPVIRYFLQKLQRSSESEYTTAFAQMLQFEMEEEEKELKKFERNNVKLTFHKDRVFYFPITVSKMILSMISMESFFFDILIAG